MGTNAGDDINADDYEGDIDALEGRMDDLEAGWQSFTPVFGLGLNPVTLGNGTRSGRYRVSSGGLDLFAELTWGSTTSWPLNDIITLQLPREVVEGGVNGRPLAGLGKAMDVSADYHAIGWVEIGVSDNLLVIRGTDGLAFDGDSPLTTWESGDRLWFALGRTELV